MTLFEFTDARTLEDVPSTTFAAQKILERADLQRALRERIDVLGDDLLVVSEEFGDFDVKRRIDLLCVDRSAQLVVVELKRTEDGGHLELQAIRYAAMVSAMTFEQLAGTFERHLRLTGSADADRAREVLSEWLEEVGGEDAVLERRVRIILVSGGFDTQITTTVLWLNDLYGLDITCVRLTPYRVADRLVLDVQQVIPLPEAAELTVKLRHREAAARAAASADGKDRTQYAIETPGGTSEFLPKRRAVLELVQRLAAAGVPAATMAGVIRRAKFLGVDGELTGEELRVAFTTRYQRAEGNLRRWFLDQPVHDAGRTWVLSKMWGVDFLDVMEELVALAPDSGIRYFAAG
ncbi:hypothetical protein E4P40_15500 [Blastococcus sp. CT_GayMR20]|uniref:hypothetical protein n=1 Tax=Blastococcus sp. CT_GayMR20 TaxID=2559609 RepID=UPI001074798F|nr:hypothetical protein [Blastococcus sp. CT_GayMR20]TFV82788.1 hypothetical protein E4P40_15500 [Blastococcus sp. CT_GayMR20]